MIEKLSAGKNYPDSFNVLIEVPMGSMPVKYEFDKDSGFMFVDRFVQTPMFYPGNYGFIPNTLADDGDPLDVIVFTKYPLIPGCVIEARAIGVILMEDEKGRDEKIVAVPMPKLDQYYANVNDIKDIQDILIQQTRHFFEHYKDLEKGKFVKISGIGSVEEAKSILKKFILS
jgi:inorganic pyrophosphatase